jgi:hypothetical protein
MFKLLVLLSGFCQCVCHTQIETRVFGLSRTPQACATTNMGTCPFIGFTDRRVFYCVMHRVRVRDEVFVNVFVARSGDCTWTSTRSWGLERRENREPFVLPRGAAKKTGAAEADLHVLISIIHGSTCIY